MLAKLRALAAKAGNAARWFAVKANRNKVYRVAKWALPVAVAAGLLTSGEASTILTVAGVLVGAPALHLADRNSR